jgi:hypothetical protein
MQCVNIYQEDGLKILEEKLICNPISLFKGCTSLLNQILSSLILCGMIFDSRFAVIIKTSLGTNQLVNHLQ